jgi:hypothetical protein
VTIAPTLLCHGGPLRATVAADGRDERAVAAWRDRAGRHGRHLHEHLVGRGQVDLQRVPADEPDVRTVGGRLGMALALAVPSRLRLGGGIGPRRDLTLIMAVVRMARAAARGPAILACVDGLASYVTALTRVVRDPVRTGRRGRPRLVATPGRLLGQVIERHAGRRVVGITRRVARGTAAAIAAAVAATGTGTGIDTADIERLNATFRGALSALVRRGRAIAHAEGTLRAGMDLVGCADNFCWDHDSLRRAGNGRGGPEWRRRTPAMAAGPTARRWTMPELLSHPIPPPPWVAPKRRGRPPKQEQSVRQRAA